MNFWIGRDLTVNRIIAPAGQRATRRRPVRPSWQSALAKIPKRQLIPLARLRHGRDTFHLAKFDALLERYAVEMYAVAVLSDA
jgi:hypothetical protein